jgi:GNAT superfamily N-acetyltransferase
MFVDPLIRRAQPCERDALNALTRRSAMHWGYEPEFLEWEPEAITLTQSALANDPVFVIEQDGAVLGFYHLSGTPDALFLDKLFVEPDAIGSGFGKILWNHAIDHALKLEARELSLFSDPNAAWFYRRMGATWIREIPTSRPGWNLQFFRYSLSPAAPAQTTPAPPGS